MTTKTTSTSVRGQFTIQMTTEPHDEHPRLLKHIYINAQHPTDGRVGSLVALEVDRDKCRGDLILILDEESQELSEFATTLFDKFGRLKSELVEHEHLKGTGVWGRELDNGKIVYVVSVDVEEKVRGFARVLFFQRSALILLSSSEGTV